MPNPIPEPSNSFITHSRGSPPLLGEHTEEILSKKIGLSEAEIKNLKDNEII